MTKVQHTPLERILSGHKHCYLERSVVVPLVESCRHSGFTPVLSSFIAFLPKSALNPATGQGFLGRYVFERLMCFRCSVKLSEEMPRPMFI